MDFILKGYSSLVQDLRHQILTDPNLTLDKSHILWVITYFLKFAAQLEVEMAQIGYIISHDLNENGSYLNTIMFTFRPVLSVATISYLTFEGVRLFEELELACRERIIDLKPFQRRMHLVVSAINEFILTLDKYLGFAHFPKEEQQQLEKLQISVTITFI